MGFFFFDESVHVRGGFVLGAWVFMAGDPSDAIDEAICACALVPGRDEFKSGRRMVGDEMRHKLRDRMWQVFFSGHARVGLTIVPIESRAALGAVALEALQHLIVVNELSEEPHAAYLDQGLFGSASEALIASALFGLPSELSLFPEQDSRAIRGLQLADLVAHTTSMLLLAHLGLVRKKVAAGPDSGFDPDDELDLEYVLRNGLRWMFFSAPSSVGTEWSYEFQWADVAARGLYFPSQLQGPLREAFVATFGRAWLGCTR